VLIGLKRAEQRSQRRSLLQHEMQTILLRDIQTGKFTACGYPAQAGADDLNVSPVIIPVHLMQEQFVRWDEGAVIAPPREFRWVRIVDIQSKRPPTDLLAQNTSSKR